MDVSSALTEVMPPSAPLGLVVLDELAVDHAEKSTFLILSVLLELQVARRLAAVRAAALPERMLRKDS